MDGMAPSDAELLNRWRSGNAQAGEVLFDRYYPQLERFFMNKVSDSVADLVHDTLHRCLRARDNVTAPERFRSYLFTIAYNLLRTHLRTLGRRGQHLDFDAVTVAGLTARPSSVLAKKRQHRLLLEGLRHIPVTDQVLLELHYWQALSLAEIAQIVGRNQNTIKGQLRRARERLKDAMGTLDETPAVLASTSAELDRWAAECRDGMTQSPDRAQPES